MILLDAAISEKQIALEGAQRMAGNPGPYRVSQRHPCPVCGRPKWCLHDETSGVTLCPRKSEGSLLRRDGRPIRFGEFGYLHTRGVNSIYIGGPVASRPLRPAKKPAMPAEVLQSIADGYTLAAAELLPAASAELGLPVESLRDLGLGHDNGCWTWGERTATGEVCGIGTRRRGTGDKRFRVGGRRGIILSTVHATDLAKLRSDIIARGRVVLPEGFTDGVAVHATGEVAIGRPSVSCATQEIATLLRNLDLPESVSIVLLGENDQAADGTWPGRDQAQEAARKLGSLLGRPVAVLMPPGGVKDVREAWRAEVRTWGEYARNATTLLSPCQEVADRCSCVDSPVVSGSLLPANRHNATIPQRVRERFASNPSDCPEVFWTGGQTNGSPALIAATCGKRSCPVCGAYWKLKTFKRFHHHLTDHDGQLYHGEVSDFDWRAVAAGMRRQAKKTGIPFRYLAIRQAADETTLVVIASVPVGAVARPVEVSAALDLLADAVDGAAMGPRPVQACRAWGRLSKGIEVQRAPGGASPSAFRATARAWGTDTTTGGRFILCDRPGLLLDEIGQTDIQAREDFWYEAWLRDNPGSDDPDQFHCRAAECRERLRRKPPPAAATCQHDQVAETPTFDGHVNRQCRECGEWLPCRRADRAP